MEKPLVHIYLCTVKLKKKVKMKTRLLSFICIMFSTVTISAFTSSNSIINIEIRRVDTSTETSPRSFDNIPLRSLYNGFDKFIYINFAHNIGNTEIIITNYSTGEVVYDSADSSNGQAVIQTSGTPGDYLLQIETESGDCYEGEFTVE